MFSFTLLTVFPSYFAKRSLSYNDDGVVSGFSPVSVGWDVFLLDMQRGAWLDIKRKHDVPARVHAGSIGRHLASILDCLSSF